MDRIVVGQDGNPAMRVYPSMLFMTEVIRMAEEGAMAPAAFQRPYAWDRGDVEDFLESAMNGYSLGTLTMWYPLEEDWASGTIRNGGRLGPIACADGRPALLLDGHNRMATLAWAMSGKDSVVFEGVPAGERNVWEPPGRLVVDLDQRRACFSLDPLLAGGRQVPFEVFMEPRAMNRHIRHSENSISDADLDWIDGTQSRVRDTRISVVNISHASVREAARTFRLINKAGQPMTERDMESAFGLETGQDHLQGPPGP